MSRDIFKFRNLKRHNHEPTNQKCRDPYKGIKECSEWSAYYNTVNLYATANTRRGRREQSELSKEQ